MSNPCGVLGPYVKGLVHRVVPLGGGAYWKMFGHRLSQGIGWLALPQSRFSPWLAEDAALPPTCSGDDDGRLPHHEPKANRASKTDELK